MHYNLLIHPNLNAIYSIVWSGSPFNHNKKNHGYYYKNVVLNYFLATLFSDLKYMYNEGILLVWNLIIYINF